MHRCNNTFRWFFVACLSASTIACRKDPPQETPNAPAESDPGATLVFPETLRVGDESVNQFVRTALTQSATGDYDAFRALWSAKREPISRAEFEEAWHAVHRMAVRALQKAYLEVGDESQTRETVYLLLVEVELNPEARAGKRSPVREIVLMLVKEHDQWRLAPAPKEMRDWIKRQSQSGSVDTPATGQP